MTKLPQEIINYAEAARLDKKPTGKDFLLFCQEGIGLAKKNPAFKHKIAYAIVEQGRLFADFGQEDSDSIRAEIKDLAAGLELPDEHIYVAANFSIDDQWRMMGELVKKGLATLSEAST